MFWEGDTCDSGVGYMNSCPRDARSASHYVITPNMLTPHPQHSWGYTSLKRTMKSGEGVVVGGTAGLRENSWVAGEEGLTGNTTEPPKVLKLDVIH